MRALLSELDGLIGRRDIKRAEVLIAKALRSAQGTDRGRALMSRARVRLIAGRPEEALEDLSESAALWPEGAASPQMSELLGDSHFARFELATLGFADRADTTAALEAYQHIHVLFPDYENLGWVLYQHGRLLLTEQRPHEAVALFEQALLAPSVFPALTAYCYERLGFIYLYELRDAARSLAFLNKALDTYPESEPRHWLAQVHTLRSRVLRTMTNLPAALAAAEAAVSTAAAGGSEARIGLADAAMAAAELAAQMGGQDRQVVVHVQMFLQNSRRPPGIDVTWSRAHELLGDAQYRLGQSSAALSAYQAALQYNPYHPWELSLYYRISRCYYSLAEYTRAAAALERMLEVAEKDGETISDFRVYQLLANTYFACERFERAAEAYQTALSLAPRETDHIAELVHYMHLARERSGWTQQQ